MKGFCAWLQRSGWCWHQWEDAASPCMSLGAGLPFTLAVNAFQSCSERKRRVPSLLVESQSLGSALHPGSLCFICHHHKALEKSRAVAE